MNIIKRTAELLGYELINKKHQPSLMPHLRNLIRQDRVDLVIDAGANRGQFSLLLRRYGYRGEIHSFEPVSSAFEILEKVSSKDHDWHVHQLALGDENGQQVINISNLTPLSSFLEPTNFGKQNFTDIAAVDRETVEVRTLCTVFEELGIDCSDRTILLKMDTQGYDLKVFTGARAFHDNIACIVSEVSYKPLYSAMPSYLDVLKAYEEGGFGVTGFFPVTRSQDLSVIEMDCVLKRSDAAGRHNH